MIRIKIPATTANLGPGFDSLGLALNLYNEFNIEEIEKGLRITGFEEEHSSKDNLVYASMMKTFEHIGYNPGGVEIHGTTAIPISRGLGSSATCILAGVMGANELAGGLLEKQEILQLATDIEGHPDNIAAALFGGLVISIMEGEDVIYNRIEVAKGIKQIVLIPDFTLSTEDSRDVLPTVVKYRDCINNIGRVSLLISALSDGKFELLRYALKDSIHEPYRGKLIPGFFDIVRYCEELGSLGVHLSGAGPSIMCFVDEDNYEFLNDIGLYLQARGNDWEVRELNVDTKGANIIHI